MLNGHPGLGVEDEGGCGCTVKGSISRNQSTAVVMAVARTACTGVKVVGHALPLRLQWVAPWREQLVSRPQPPPFPRTTSHLSSPTLRTTGPQEPLGYGCPVTAPPLSMGGGGGYRREWVGKG